MKKQNVIIYKVQTCIKNTVNINAKKIHQNINFVFRLVGLQVPLFFYLFLPIYNEF